MHSGCARVAVVGAGWAGCAAAVRLAQAGVRVSLYEQVRQPGGRARTVPVGDVGLDNGQHLLIGAYRATLDLIALLHADGTRELFHDLPLTVRPFGTCAAPTFVAANWRAPWHFLRAVVTARGWSWRERFALAAAVRAVARGERTTHDETVERRYAALPRAVYHGLWEPLCIAALNTPPGRASACIFDNVLRSALCGTAAASRFLVPKIALGDLLPERAVSFIAGHGGDVHLGQRVRRITAREDEITVATAVRVEAYDAVVIAVGPHQLGQLDVDAGGPAWLQVRERVAALQYESIHTIHLGYTQAQTLAPVQRLDDAPGQWVFDAGDALIAGERLRLLSVVISANGPQDQLPHSQLAHDVDVQLRRLSPRVGALRFSRVFAERRATYSCVPELDRPRAGRVSARLHLAGDYTHARYPATLEAAVQTGEIAARSVLAEIAAQRSAAPARRE